MTTESNGFFQIIRQNAGLKVLAFLLAIVSWYVVREETRFEQTIHGIVVNVTPPDGWIIQSQSLAHADVVFRGSRGDIRELTGDDVEIAIDMRKWKAVTANIVHLATKYVRAPAGVRALRVEPSAMTVNLEKIPNARLPPSN